MIQLSKGNIPHVLKQRQQEWTANLINLVKRYKTYSNIPKKELDAVLKYYKEISIQKAVIDVTNGNCVFCETYIGSDGFPHVEHFYPKAIYPKLTFFWLNLFPACSKCNIQKGDSDTKTNPIVNPVLDDPELYFEFENLRIEVSKTSPDKIKSKNTIEFCDLQRVSLSRSYAEILYAFYETENKLKDHLAKFNSLKRKSDKLKIIYQIKEAIDNVREQTKYSSQYAGFLRHLILKSKTIANCILLFSNYSNELSINLPYSAILK